MDEIVGELCDVKPMVETRGGGEDVDKVTLDGARIAAVMLSNAAEYFRAIAGTVIRTQDALEYYQEIRDWLDDDDRTFFGSFLTACDLADQDPDRYRQDILRMMRRYGGFPRVCSDLKSRMEREHRRRNRRLVS